MKYSALICFAGGLFLSAGLFLLWKKITRKQCFARNNDLSVLQELENGSVAREKTLPESLCEQYLGIFDSLNWYLSQQKLLDKFTDKYRILIRKEHYLRFIAWVLYRNGYHVELPGLQLTNANSFIHISARKDQETVLILCLDRQWNNMSYDQAQKSLVSAGAIAGSTAQRSHRIRLGLVCTGRDKQWFPRESEKNCSTSAYPLETVFAELKHFPLLHFYPSLLGRSKSVFAPGEREYDLYGLPEETRCFYTQDEFEFYIIQKYRTLSIPEQDEEFLKILLSPEADDLADFQYSRITLHRDPPETAQKSGSSETLPTLQEIFDQTIAGLPSPE